MRGSYVRAVFASTPGILGLLEVRLSGIQHDIKALKSQRLLIVART
jgi:hypothetical protein